MEKKSLFSHDWVGFATVSGSIFSTVLWFQIRILQNDTDPGGSGSGSETLVVKEINLLIRRHLSLVVTVSLCKNKKYLPRERNCDNFMIKRDSFNISIITGISGSACCYLIRRLD